MHLGYFIFWTNSSWVPALSSYSTWAVLLQYIFWLKEMSERIPVHSHQGHPGMRSTACGDHKGVCLKSTFFLQTRTWWHYTLCQAKKNRSILLSKDRSHRKWSLIAGKGLLLPSPAKWVNSRQKHVTCYHALGFTFELTKHIISVLVDFVMILHIRS